MATVQPVFSGQEANLNPRVSSSFQRHELDTDTTHSTGLSYSADTNSSYETNKPVKNVQETLNIPTAEPIHEAVREIFHGVDYSLEEPKLDDWKIPATPWVSSIHPHAAEATNTVDGYFLKHWPFHSPKSKKTFLNAGFSRVTCLYFPAARDDRIQFACKLLTVLFLIDDMLEDMSLADGKAFNEELMPIMRGLVPPDRVKAAQYILYDLFQDMRRLDTPLADAVLEPTFVFMRAQTDKTRLGVSQLGQYLVYREKDVGKALLSALMRFSMDLHLTPNTLCRMDVIERYCAKHLSIVNDILSWEKEFRASKTGHVEGSALCSSVKVLADETGLGVEASKRILWHITREWERVFDLAAEKVLKCGGEGEEAQKEEVELYIKGLRAQMSGNEAWSLSTLRYIKP